MRRITTSAVIMGLVISLSGQLWAGGARVIVRPGAVAVGVAPGGVVSRRWANGGFVAPGYSYQTYYYIPGPYYRQYYAPVIVVSPYYYPYYVAHPVVVNAPFFCLLHETGFISRAGMLDHLAGTHKFALETAASICPEGIESCLFPSY